VITGVAERTRRWRTAAGLAGLLALAGGGWIARPSARPALDVCAPDTTIPGPSHDLYCVPLLPAPGVTGVTGEAALTWRGWPFTVAVTPDGVTRFRAELRLTGLPPVESLGPYRHYVAWVAPPLMAPMVNLGEVGNGRTETGPVAFNKFVLLVTAESTATGTWPTGKVVVRGQGASTRMIPPDFMQFTLGAVPAGTEDRHDGPGGWPTPPMRAGLQMWPVMMRLRPAVVPVLPAPPPESLPPARPREILPVADGDTVALTAGFVRRRLGGRDVTMYGFNGQYPGPLLWVPQAATITVDFRNTIDWPSTIHWHGVRLDNRFDGVPGVTQDPVPPGGRFRYRVRFPDAGIYWYHPHVREDIQQDLGLYGNILVRSPRPDFYSPANREEVLMLDDLLVGADGPAPYGRERATHTLMGRFGNVFLINGDPDYRLAVLRGEVVRFFLTNVSNTRTFNLSFGGARIKVVGADIGNFERERWVESVVIAPAERYVIHVRFDLTGPVAIENRVQGIDHVNGTFLAEVDTLGTVRVAETVVGRDLGATFARAREDSAVIDGLAPYRRMVTQPPDRTLVLTMRTADLPFTVARLMMLDSMYFNPVEWSGTMPFMNWASTPTEVQWILRDPATERENMAIDWRFHRGQVVKVRLVNERRVLHAMQHPIHIHGQRFLILDMNGVPNDDLAWKDTILLPVGATADILLELSNPGRWMLHCHIAEHLESGMHMIFTVE